MRRLSTCELNRVSGGYKLPRPDPRGPHPISVLSYFDDGSSLDVKAVGDDFLSHATPQVERVIAQGREMDDCWAVEAINAIARTPAGRAHLDARVHETGPNQYDVDLRGLDGTTRPIQVTLPDRDVGGRAADPKYAAIEQALGKMRDPDHPYEALNKGGNTRDPLYMLGMENIDRVRVRDFAERAGTDPLTDGSVVMFGTEGDGKKFNLPNDHQLSYAGSGTNALTGEAVIYISDPHGGAATGALPVAAMMDILPVGWSANVPRSEAPTASTPSIEPEVPSPRQDELVTPPAAENGTGDLVRVEANDTDLSSDALSGVDLAGDAVRGDGNRMAILDGQPPSDGLAVSAITDAAADPLADAFGNTRGTNGYDPHNEDQTFAERDAADQAADQSLGRAMIENDPSLADRDAATTDDAVRTAEPDDAVGGAVVGEVGSGDEGREPDT